MAKELKELKAKAKWPHQQLIEVEYVADVLGKDKKPIVKKGQKAHVGLKAADELVKLGRAKKVA